MMTRVEQALAELSNRVVAIVDNVGPGVDPGVEAALLELTEALREAGAVRDETELEEPYDKRYDYLQVDYGIGPTKGEPSGRHSEGR
jgi:hypothetical protein